MTSGGRLIIVVAVRVGFGLTSTSLSLIVCNAFDFFGSLDAWVGLEVSESELALRLLALELAVVVDWPGCGISIQIVRRPSVTL